MKHTTLTVAILFSLTGLAPVLATEQAESDKPAEAISSDSEASTTLTTDTSRPMSGMGMRHKGQCKHGKGHGGMKHGHHDKHDRVAQRLDMIEARLAKIEAMLESLMRR